MRHQLLPFLVKDNQDFQSDTVVLDDGEWRSLPNDSKSRFLAEKWVSTENAGYIRTRSGTLLKVTIQSITKLDAPGDCEATVGTETETLPASFRRTRVYEYHGQWHLRASHPYSKGEGEYWAHLGDQGDKLAYALEAMPVVDKKISSGTDMKFIRNAPTLLWVFERDEWKLVETK